MSTYGTYINGEDPNKKDPNAVGATTPTTPPVLTYEGFIGTGTASNAYKAGVGLIGSNYTTAVDAAEANKQLGMNYAQGVKNSIYGSAASLRQQTDANTEAARQRGIVDSQSSYQKAVGAYGSNAETLAGRGLSGSGYGEYLTADAYATHRGQVQDINAGALEANRKAANLEAQTKMAADSEYLKNLYDIESEYNTAKSTAETEKTKGLYELGVGLDTARDEAYTSLIDAAANGTSLDIIKQSGAWGDLTPEQQTAVIAEAEKITADVEKTENLTAIDTMIQNGDSAEAIKNSDAYKNLDDTAKVEVDKTLDQRAKNEENAVNNLAGAVSQYTSIDDVRKFLDAPDANGNYVSDDIKEKVIAQWQSANANETLEGIYSAEYTDGKLLINGEEITGAEIYEDIQSGKFGADGARVARQYVESLIAMVQNAEDGTKAYEWAIEQIEALGALASTTGLKYYAPVTDAGITRADDGSIVAAYSAHGQLYEEVGDTSVEESMSLDAQGGKNATTIEKNGTVYIRVGDRKNGVGYWVKVKPISEIK